MAFSEPFKKWVETPQTRKDQPGKFWANVIVALLILPLAVGAVYFSTTELFAAINKQGL